MNQISKAVLPLSSFTDDFLPATKAMPKEMLPVVDKPLIQYAVEEAAAAGITDIIFVTGRGKRIVEDHFDKAYELEEELAACGENGLLAELRTQMPIKMRFSAVHQRDGGGFGDVLLCAEPFMGNEPFAVLLPDQLIDAEPAALSQLVTLFAANGKPVIGMQTASAPEACGGGAIITEHGIDLAGPSIARESMLPAGHAGRYIFTAVVFDCLRRSRAAGAPQISLDELFATLPAFAETMHCEVSGRRYDCSIKVGYMKAMADYGMKHPAIGVELSSYVASLKARKRHDPAAQQ